jgi:hypothetical protein
MSPISDPNYNAKKQRKYRDRLKIKDQLGSGTLGIHLERACFSLLRRDLINDHRSIEDFVGHRWDGDLITPLVFRATQSPSATTDANMSALLTQVTGDFVASLAPMSAAAKLFDFAVQANLDGISSMLIPRRAGPIDPNKAQWIDEGAPVLVPTIPLEGMVLGPMKKLGSLIVFTQELAEHSSNAEEVFRTLMIETVSVQLDASVLSNLAATTARPAGILNGVAPIAGSTDMAADLGKLAGAIGSVTSNLAFVGHPNQINAIRMKYGSNWSADILLIPTVGVASGTVIAIDPLALAASFGEPKISTSSVAMVQMDDAPSANPMDGPTRSLFQSYCMGLRVLLDVAYVLRLTGSVAWTNSAQW